MQYEPLVHIRSCKFDEPSVPNSRISVLSALASCLPRHTGMEQWAPLGFRGAVEEFKRRLIETALRQSGGNRTHAARCLGLQRTYLLRLIRDLGVSAPPPASASGNFSHPRSSPEPGAHPAPPSPPVVPPNGRRPPGPGEKR